MSVQVLFNPDRQRLEYYQTAADAQYWEDHWDDSGFEGLQQNQIDRFVEKKTLQYLPKGSRVLEGGCGTGIKVNTLHRAGFKVVGLDFAQKTIEKAKQIKPELEWVCGDVRHLPFTDQEFEGIWSLGVIEHFYTGYDQILQEMHRVLKKDGFVFLTFPVLSPLRQSLSRKGTYPDVRKATLDPSHFYQFALHPKTVRKDFEVLGFKVLEMRGLDGVKGLKDELKNHTAFQRLLRQIYQCDRIWKKAAKRLADLALNHYSPHIQFFVLKKRR